MDGGPALEESFQRLLYLSDAGTTGLDVWLWFYAFGLVLGLAPELRFHDVQASVPLRHPPEGSWFTVQGFRFRGTCRDPKIVSPLAPALEIHTTLPQKPGPLGS